MTFYTIYSIKSTLNPMIPFSQAEKREAVSFTSQHQSVVRFERYDVTIIISVLMCTANKHLFIPFVSPPSQG